MYQCEHCGADTPDHACPGPDVKSDTTEKADTDVAVGDQRANHLRQHHETERVYRLRRIQELQDEGLAIIDIAAGLGITESSVRSIMRKDRLRKLDEPLQSSLKVSLSNHTPGDAELERIKEIRHLADDLCELIDQVCPDNSREADIARQHLEETVMWAVKSVVMPTTPEEVRAFTERMVAAAR